MEKTDPSARITGWERAHLFDRHLWLFPLTFLFHIYEESHGFYNWVTVTLGGHMLERLFYINNAAFVLLSCGLCWLCAHTRKPWALFLLFFGWGPRPSGMRCSIFMKNII